MYTSLFKKKILNVSDLRHLQELIMQMWIPLKSILLYNHIKYDATFLFLFLARQSPLLQGLVIHEVSTRRSHTSKYHSR